MKKTPTLLMGIVMLCSVSCQKELSSDVTAPVSNNSTGKLFAMGVIVTGLETNTTTATWNANKRLMKYVSTGSINGASMDGSIEFFRAGNGNVTKVFELPIGSSGMIDSIIYYPHYVPGTNRLAYVTSTFYSSFIDLKDSTLYTYNSIGRIVEKESYRENIVSGILEKNVKQLFSYDAVGNLTGEIIQSIDASGNYTTAETNIITYDLHIQSLRLEEEAFIVLGETSVSPNHMIKKVMSGPAQPPITITFTANSFNGTAQPVSGGLTVTPLSVGHNSSFTYYYH